MSAERVGRAQAAMRERGIDVLFVGPSADLRYLVGYAALALERPTLLVVPAEGDAEMVVPQLEAPRAAASGAPDLVDLRTFGEETDPFELVRAIVHDADVEPACAAVQDRLWSAFTLRLQAAFPGIEWRPGSDVMRALRLVKTPDEVEALRRVARAIDGVHAQIPPLLRPGRTEAEVGRDIEQLILAEHDEVNFVIVAAGPNGASPHHEPGAHAIEAGEPVVIDIGGTLDGYCSDATRNYVVGTSPDGYEDLHEVLLAAQRAAVAAVRPGASAGAVDAAAREVIEEAGHGEAFIHRTGHGIGVEEHEEPWIVSGNDQTLTAGMTFSVEPGIYVADRYGARIEDIVAVTPDGVERLNVLDRDLVRVDPRQARR